MESNYLNEATHSQKDVSLTKFYIDQTGGGMNDFYSGYRYLPNQRGNGFFGKLIKTSLFPLLKSILPYLRDTAIEGVGDLIGNIKSGKNIKQAAKSTLRNTASSVLTDMASKVKAQQGSGLRRRRRSPKKRVNKSVYKRKRTTRKRKQGKRGKKKCILFT